MPECAVCNKGLFYIVEKWGKCSECGKTFCDDCLQRHAKEHAVEKEVLRINSEKEIRQKKRLSKKGGFLAGATAGEGSAGINLGVVLIAVLAVIFIFSPSRGSAPSGNAQDTPVIPLAVSRSYGWCILIACIMMAQCIMAGVSVNIARRGYFSASFFAEHFREVASSSEGYPDNGNGRYAAKLSDEDWATFNTLQRVHLNYVEALTPAVASELLCGLFFPRFAVMAGTVYIAGRALYAKGYVAHGLEGHWPGL